MAKQRSHPQVRRRQQRQRRSSTPSTPLERVKQAAADAKRQYLKKQKAKKHRQRMGTLLANAAQRARRERWAAIALETQGIVLGDGKYVEERPAPFVSSSIAQPSDGQGSSPPTLSVSHNIAMAITLSRQRTIFYPHYSATLAKWQDTRVQSLPPSIQIDFIRNSTLNVAREISLARFPDPFSSTDIGVMSFASAKRPGGGFLHGSSEQEDTIARLSSLVASLSSPAAQRFYKEHRAFQNEDGSGLHDHSMVYSPGVVVFRKDADDESAVGRKSPPPNDCDSLGGEFIAPFKIDVLSVVPVNAAAVRQKHLILPGEQQLFEDGIRQAMKERMARALRVFEEHGNRVLVLGAFGSGSYENKVEMIASIWAELLVCGDTVGDVKREARFKNSFERVVFAVPGKLFEQFKRAFKLRLDEEMLTVATLG